MMLSTDDLLDAWKYCAPIWNDKVFVSHKVYNNLMAHYTNVAAADPEFKLHISPSPDVGEDEFFLIQGNQAGKRTLQRNYIRELRAKLEKEQGMGLMEISQSLAQSDRSFMDYMNKMQNELYATEQRPTLAERLDRAEEALAEEKQRHEATRIELQTRRRDRDEHRRMMQHFKDRAERAEAMAKKVDLVASDLEACRRDMGDKRFNEVIGANWKVNGDPVAHDAGSTVRDTTGGTFKRGTLVTAKSGKYKAW